MFSIAYLKLHHGDEMNKKKFIMHIPVELISLTYLLQITCWGEKQLDLEFDQ